MGRIKPRPVIPLVFVHGFGLGFNRIDTDSMGLDYWYQIPQDLARNGATAFAAELSAVASNELRGEQLLMQVDEVLAITSARKLNLPGHSQGGPTIQYIEAIAPQKIASLTAIAGAMKGTPIMEKGRNSPVLKPLLSALSTVLGYTGSDYPVSAEDSMLALSTTEMEKFNQKYGSTAITKDCHSNGDKVTKNGIYHYSWMGNQQATNALDVLESTVVTLTSQLIKPQENDGTLPLCSGRYGQIIRQDYKHNHFFGIIGVFAQDPVMLYRQHANRLKLQGL